MERFLSREPFCVEPVDGTRTFNPRKSVLHRNTLHGGLLGGISLSVSQLKSCGWRLCKFGGEGPLLPAPESNTSNSRIHPDFPGTGTVLSPELTPSSRHQAENPEWFYTPLGTESKGTWEEVGSRPAPRGSKPLPSGASRPGWSSSAAGPASSQDPPEGSVPSPQGLREERAGRLGALGAAPGGGGRGAAVRRAAGSGQQRAREAAVAVAAAAALG
ncbi:uncharacterized protein LOC125079888 [Lutra lutra]|uniref:uncharacterized protein LOC125079888 n=1 Tax=Lutra lutra TaxID=9657 RepID=UPI001FD4F774|nr:uncharacterized protein LOC125079888 [Lutra lutra]